jgi:hypothetical protein
MIMPEAKAWPLSLACDKPKDHGYPHELWTTRLLARHGRENGPAAGHNCLANLVLETRVFSLGLPFSFRSRYFAALLRTLLDEFIGRRRQFDSHADSLRFK